MISKSVVKVLGPSATPFVENFLTRNKNFLESKTLSTKLNIIGNYIDLLHEKNYSKLGEIEAEELLSSYNSFLEEYKNKHTTVDYQETNKVILDWRVNGLGMYWVDLQKEFCLESMIRMKDCGRVNYGNTTLELREQLENSNVSHLVIVYERKTGTIKQVKGKSNSKPGEEYYKDFYNFLMNTDYRVSKYIPTYRPENDLKVEELPLNMQLDIQSRFPKLVKIKSII